MGGCAASWIVQSDIDAHMYRWAWTGNGRRYTHIEQILHPPTLRGTRTRIAKRPIVHFKSVVNGLLNPCRKKKAINIISSAQGGGEERKNPEELHARINVAVHNTEGFKVFTFF